MGIDIDRITDIEDCRRYLIRTSASIMNYIERLHAKAGKAIADFEAVRDEARKQEDRMDELERSLIILTPDLFNKDLHSTLLIRKAQGKVIDIIEFTDKKVIIKFEDKTKITIFDDGQSCCEYRYLTTDDNVISLCGAKFHSVNIKDATQTKLNGGLHEIQFLEIQTFDKGSITFAAHNENNGYYCGFNMRVK